MPHLASQATRQAVQQTASALLQGAEITGVFYSLARTGPGLPTGNKGVVSMHSVMKQKIAPLMPKRQLAALDMRAYSAAIEHMLAVKDSAGPLQAGMGTYSRQASARRISAEKYESDRAALLPATASRRLFSPADADSAGYRQKHGRMTASASRSHNRSAVGA